MGLTRFGTLMKVQGSHFSIEERQSNDPYLTMNTVRLYIEKKNVVFLVIWYNSASLLR